ncbi:MAG: HIT family protein [Lachnospiraceae bacterium]|nr:HIT family protein [Lachnospiraceae bacterium]
MKDDNCIFCKLAAGEIPSNTLYEDTDFRVIMDISPAVKGHAIVLPKQHMNDLLEVETDTAAKALFVVSKVANAVKDALGCDGINILQNNGEAAGQSIFHLHFHVLPRFHEDRFTIPWKPLSYAEGEAEEIAGKIRAVMQKHKS